MVQKRFPIVLDVKNTSSGAAMQPVVVHGDNGNVFDISMRDSGEPIVLTGCLVVAVFSRDDGLTAAQDTTGNGITFDATDTSLIHLELYTGSTYPGLVTCQIQIYSGDNHLTLITSARFNFKCEKGISNSETIKAATEWPLLVDALARTEAVEEAEALRVTAEGLRDTAETARETAESSRASAETSRASAETSRTSAESSRATAESGRVSAESARVSAESTRAAAESGRTTAESARASAESSRVSAETSRASAESARATAEISRANAETERAENETARQNAETLRETFADKWRDMQLSVTGLPYTAAPTAAVSEEEARFSVELGIPQGEPGTVNNHTHGNITNDGKVGNVADLPIFTLSGGSVGTKTPVTAQVALGVRSNQNLLHNWDLRQGGIVNQRALTSYAGGAGGLFNYCVDRWVISNINASATSDGLQITGVSGGDSILAQRLKITTNGLQAPFILGKTFTLSVMVGDVIYSTTVTMPSAFPATTTKYGTLETPFGSIKLALAASTSFWCEIYVTLGTTITVQTAKLEYGSISTLINDVPVYDGTELVKCQRFLWVMSGYNRYRCGYIDANTLSFFVPSPVTLRANPTFTGTEIDVLSFPNGAVQTGFTFSYWVKNSGITVIASKTSHAMTDAALVIVDGLFSAEL